MQVRSPAGEYFKIWVGLLMACHGLPPETKTLKLRICACEPQMSNPKPKTASPKGFAPQAYGKLGKPQTSSLIVKHIFWGSGSMIA